MSFESQYKVSLLLFIISFSCFNISAQQVIEELTIDFDNNEEFTLTIAKKEDLDNIGFFGVRNGRFEITDLEGTRCPPPFSNTNGFNDNIAFIISQPAQSSFCNVSIEVDISLSGAIFEPCASPGQNNPIGCTGIGGSGAGGDGLNVEIALNGQLILSGGYCGSNREGDLSISGLDIEIGDVIIVTIIGGTQAPDESYYLDRILVQGQAASLFPPTIEANSTELCANIDALVLNVININSEAQYIWRKDGIELSEGTSALIRAPIRTDDAGVYSVTVIEPSGCSDETEIEIFVNTCTIQNPEFSLLESLCQSDTLILNDISDNGIVGQWNLSSPITLDDSSEFVDLLFIPSNGGENYSLTIEVLRSYSDTIKYEVCPGDTIINNGTAYTLEAMPFGQEKFIASNGCDSTVIISLLPLNHSLLTIRDTVCYNDSILVNEKYYTPVLNSSVDTLIDTNGCDSIVNVEIFFKDELKTFIKDTICPGETVVINGTTYNSDKLAGIDTLTSINSCDSIVYVDIHKVVPDTIFIPFSLCEGRNEMIRDIPITDANDALIFQIGPHACDTILIYEIQHLSNIEDYRTDTLCQSNSLIINNQQYNVERPTGIEVLEASNGCDSIIHIDLSFYDEDVFDINENHCIGDGYSIQIGENTYDENHPMGQEILSGINGCDSIVNVELVFGEQKLTEEIYVGCEGDGYSVEVNGTEYGETNPNGIETTIGINGCDNIITIDLDFQPVLYGIETYLGCQGDEFEAIINGNVYNESNPVGTEIITGINGCDSIVDIALFYQEAVQSREEYQGCTGDGYFVFVNEKRYDENCPMGLEILSGINGCDSIVNVELVFGEQKLTEEIYVGCQGDGYSVEVNGTEYGETNPNGIETTIGINGCDSIITIDLDYQPVLYGIETYMGCQGDEFEAIINGNVYNESNPVGTEIITGINGCDSIVDIALFYQEAVQSREEYQGCTGDGYFVFVNEKRYDESCPMGQEILSGINGCDSIVNVELVFGEQKLTEEIYVGCEGDGYSIVVNGTEYGETNPNGIETSVGSKGCDSIITIDLDYQPVLYDIETYLGCQGDGFEMIINGNIYNESNPEGTEILMGKNGCDSIVDIALFYQESVQSLEEYQGCTGDGYFVFVNDILYDEFNSTGVEYLVSAKGCDSLVMVNLEYNANTTQIIAESHCYGDAYTLVIADQIFNENNPTGRVILDNTAGCDSIIEIVLSYSDHITMYHSETLCEGKLIVINEFKYDINNPTGTQNLISQTGCDSILEISINFYDNPIVELLIDTLILNQEYQIIIQSDKSLVDIEWSGDTGLSCNDCADPIISIRDNSYYKVVVTDSDGCSFESSIDLTIKEQDLDIYFPNIISINSSLGNDRFQPIGPEGINATYDVHIYDRWGSVVFSRQKASLSDPQSGWDGKINGKYNIGVYVYLVELYDQNYLEPKVYSGNVMVVD